MKIHLPKIFILLLFLTRTLQLPDTISEKDFFEELNECTTGIASVAATPDGRPLLWKSRDCGNSNQEFHYEDDGQIPFISVCYENDVVNYFGGLNAHGFAVENSTCYNLGMGAGWNGDSGRIHAIALSTCRTVDDFQAILDSVQTGEGIESVSIYGCIDAFGGAAYFETAAREYTRIDAIESEYGFLIRANYAYSGDMEGELPDHWGQNRHDRAYALWKSAVESENLTPQYLYRYVIRNLHPPDMDNYQLPYEGYFEEFPYGCLPYANTICRTTTRSTLVAQGVRAGERPENSILWAMVGSPLGCVATPLWVRAGEVPSEYDTESGSRLCSLSVDTRNYVTRNAVFGDFVDTWELHRADGSGFWDFSLTLESRIFERTDQFLASDNYHPDRLRNYQNLIARQTADSLEAWEPTRISIEISELVFWNNNVRIAWERPEHPFNQREAPVDHYRVYRATEPFRRGNSGELIETCNETEIILENEINDSSFYRVEGVH